MWRENDFQETLCMTVAGGRRVGVAQPQPASSSSSSALDNLEKRLENGQAYEGHEMCKASFNRLRLRRQATDSYAVAHGGAILQLQKGQVNCGVDLACELISAYTSDGVLADEEHVEYVIEILEAMPTEPIGEDEGPPVEAVQKIAHAALKWIRKNKTDNSRSGGVIHRSLAMYIIRSLGWMGLGLAMQHFARACSLDEFASSVAAAVSHANPVEEDLFIVRASLTLADIPSPVDDTLDGKPLARAKRFKSVYEGVVNHPVEDTPLLGFLELFIEALERSSHSLASLLLNEYGQDLTERDETLKDLAMRCQKRYAPAPVSTGGFPQGMFADLMRGMMTPSPA